MRHQNKINQLGRTAPHRKAMLSNMAASLIEHKRISTTLAKAKALRGYVEPLITKSKTDTTHSRRVVFRKLQNKDAVSELFREVAPKVGDRAGGYTRIIKTGFRQGDSAEMCIIELVDFNEIYTTEAKATKKTRRSRRGGGGGTQKESSPAPKAAEAAEEKVEAAAAAEVVEETKEEEQPKVEEKAEAAAEEAVEAKAEETPAAEAAEQAEATETAEETSEESTEESKEEAADDEEDKKES